MKSVANYKQWVESWMRHLNGSKLRTRQQGIVLRESPDFLDSLTIYSGENYILEPGGEIMDEPAPSEIAAVTEYLFNTLVGVPETKEASRSADDVRDDLLKEANVIMDPRVKLNWPVPLKLRGKDFKPRFSLYIGNGTPNCSPKWSR